MQQPQITYLALGDSYTVGEAVRREESFPYQTVAMLREKGFSIADPDVIATTGWTTDELAAAVNEYQFVQQYDLVTLLIGVNNQYRGRSLENYRKEFRDLLKRAIGLTGQKKEQVVVLTIPDYGVTPFGKTKDPEKISRELDLFNAAVREICAELGVGIVDISPAFRKALHDETMVASDGLHPSGKAYRLWAEQLSVFLQGRLK